MRKRIIGPGPETPAPAGGNWLDLGRLARVEVTSEDAAHPIDAALVATPGSGWRAGGPGTQVVRLVFDGPVRLRRVRLVFREDARARTQEFALRWSPAGGATPYRDVVRQQYTFSPPGTTEEVEEYRVDLDGAAVLELTITPDISGGESPASLAELRVE
jgi:hypothetical protein